MKNNVVILIMFQVILAGAPLNSQAIASDRAQDPEHLWDIGWELSRDSFNHCDTLHMQDTKKARLRNRGRTCALPQQSDLLQELLTPGVIRYESDQMVAKPEKQQRISVEYNGQYNGILQDLVAETSISSP
jgi:hypothetical protein